MKNLFFLLVAFSVSLSSFAQDNGNLENKFYLRFGLSNPTKAYFGIEDDSGWEDTKRIGGVFELGQIFMLNSIPLSDGLRLGVNVDYAEISYHHISSTFDDSAIGIFKLSSKIGPSISYNIVSDLILDAYVKFKIPWVAGMAFAASDGTIEDETFAGTIGTGYSIGFNVRYRFIMLCFDFNKDSMKLEYTDQSGVYFGNIGDPNDDGEKTSLPYYNFTLGFCF